MGKIIAYGIIFVFVGLAAMVLLSLFFSVIATLLIAGLVGAVIVAIVVTTITLIGMFKGDEDKSIKKKTRFKDDPDMLIHEKVEEELQSMKLNNKVQQNVQER